MLSKLSKLEVEVLEVGIQFYTPFLIGLFHEGLNKRETYVDFLGERYALGEFDKDEALNKAIKYIKDRLKLIPKLNLKNIMVHVEDNSYREKPKHYNTTFSL